MATKKGPQRIYTPQEEIMAAMNKLQDNYRAIANATTESYQNTPPREVLATAIKDLETLKQFVATRIGVPAEFRG